MPHYVINEYAVDNCIKASAKGIIKRMYAVNPINLHSLVQGMTVRECAEAMGYKSFDYALPQFWADDMRKLTGESPVGHFVWCYDDPIRGGFGYPAPISREGALLLKVYKHITVTILETVQDAMEDYKNEE